MHPRLRVGFLLTILTLLVTTSMVFAGAPGRPAVQDDEWVLVANHLHTAPGGSTPWESGLKHILEYCSNRKIEFAFITDHNSIESWFLKNFHTTGACTPIGGMEWTSDGGHANLVAFQASGPEGAILPCNSKGLPPCPPGAGQDYQGMVNATHARNGLVLINHPVLTHYKWPDATFHADAVEINRTWSDKTGQAARAWWHRRLLLGEKLTAVGGSDYHYFRPLRDEALDDCLRPLDSSPWSPDIETPVNLVRVPEKTVPAVLAAIKAGHVQVLRDLEQPRVFIGCDVDGDGNFDDFMMGDRVRAMPGKPFDLQLRVVGGKGRKLNLIEAKVGAPSRSTKVESVPVTSDDFRLPLTRTSEAGVVRFLRAEIDDRGDTVTNPVYY